MYKKYTRKQEFIMITFILLVAIVSTYYIYNKFTDERKIDYNSDTLEVIFNEKDGEKITIDKITPLNDNVGLSTKAYNFQVNNNLTEEQTIKIQIEDDLKEISDDSCEERLISKDNIKIMIKNKKESAIYRLSEIEDGIILEESLSPLANNNYTIRAWIDKDTALPAGSEFHYHGIIKVIEDSTDLAINK